MRALASFADRPHDERLAAPHVSGREDLRYARAVVVGICLDVRAGVAVDTRHYIGGERVESAETFRNSSPIDGTFLGDISRGGQREVDLAVAAARAGRTITVRYVLAPTDPAPALLAAAGPEALIVVGRRHTTTAGAFALGTCSRALLRRTAVPVVVVDGPR